MAADTFQIKRGTTAAVNAYLPAIGEPVYDITLKKLKIGDGVTLGGVESTPTNANLVALAGLTGAADTGFYFTGVGAMSTFALTPVARALLDDTTVAAQRTTLGSTVTGDALFTAASAAAARTTLGSTATGDALFITASAAAARTTLGATSVGSSVFTAVDATAARSAIGAVIGTNVQAWDADLDALAANVTSGSWHRTGAGTGAARTLTGTASQITVTNGDGVAGNPTVSFPASMSFAGKTITDGGAVTTIDINGGTIDGTTIGGSSPGAAAFTTIGATGAITPSQTAGIVGTTTNNNVNAGAVGEHITANATAQAIAAAGTIINITSISLTAGDWEVSGGVAFTPNASTTVSQVVGGISTTSVTLPTSDFNLTNLQGSLTTGAKQSFAVPSQRLSLSATTTVYLTATANFGTSTMTASGIIRARRVR